MSRTIRVTEETYEALYKLINEARKKSVYERNFQDISFDSIIQDLINKNEVPK